jgi:type IV pilus assembly protein PilQ
MRFTQEKLSMFKGRAAACLAVWGALLLGSSSAWAQNVITSVTTANQSDGDVIRVELSEALTAVPTGFSTQSPPRIAIDLPGVGNATGRSSMDLDRGNVRTLNFAQSGDRTRLVLTLKQPGTYQARLDGKALVLMVSSGTSAAAAQRPGAVGAAASQAPPAAMASNRLKGLDFRRGSEDAGRLIVDLPNSQMGAEIRQQGQTLIVEFPRAVLPEALRRRLDVADFGTPIKMVTASQQGERVRMVVEPKGNWEHSAYQTESQFVLEVRPVKADPNKLTQGPGYAGEKISFNFQSIDVRAVLQLIADISNFNIVASDAVSGNVMLRLVDVPWDQALDVVLQSRGLGQRKAGNVIWVAPKEELLAKERAELDAKSQISQLEPLRTQAFQLNYAKAEVVFAGLTGQAAGGAGGGGGGAAGGTGTRILTPRGSAIADARSNQLFVTDIPSKLDEIQLLISKIDVPVRQVVIEARIVEAGDNFGRSLGVRLGAFDRRSIAGGTSGYSIGGGNRIGIGGNLNAIGGQTKQTSDGVAFSDTRFVNLPAVGQNGYDAASFALSLFSPTANRFLNLELSAMEAENKGKIISSPRIVTADQEKALIEQGTELPYQTATSSGATALAFKKANLKLEVTPQITPEGDILMDVDVSKDSVGRVTAAGLAIDTKHAKTKVRVENGGTVVIGGIFTQDERDQETKVPLLGDIPFLGHLFKTRSRQIEKTELLIFLTPKIMAERSAIR